LAFRAQKAAKITAMRQTCLDVIQLFDIDLSKRRSLPDLTNVFRQDSESEIYLRFKESFDWLFDPQEDPAVKNNPISIPRCITCPRK